MKTCITLLGCFLLYSNVAAQCPTYQTLSGDATICQGASTIITLASSEIGVSYQLFSYRIFPPGYTDEEGETVSGTGGPLTWTVSHQDSYVVDATKGSCVRRMDGTVQINTLAASGLYGVSSSGLCVGSTITLLLSDSNSSYQLIRNGDIYGPAKVGTGSSLIWANIGNGGDYWVKATHSTSGCIRYMADTVKINPPLSNFSLTGDATICFTTNALLTLSGSEPGISYQVQKRSFDFGTTSYQFENTSIILPGTGSAIDFTVTPEIGAGETNEKYRVIAIDGSGCSSIMAGEVTIDFYSITPIPTITTSQTCGSTSVNLQGSHNGIVYSIKNSSGITSQPQTGNGSTLFWTVSNGPASIESFDPTTGCKRIIYQTINVIKRPIEYVVSGNATICGTQAPIMLSGSQLGVEYWLYEPEGGILGTPVYSSPQNGTGASLIWMVDGSTYQVEARNSLCTVIQDGVVTIEEIGQSYFLTANGSCGAETTLTLNGSQSGVNYRLKRDGIVVASKSGTGSTISWTSPLLGGIYTVEGEKNGVTCQMNGSAAINNSPNSFALTSSLMSICNESSVTLNLTGSEVGKTYRLQKWHFEILGGFQFVNTQEAISGTGSNISWTVSPHIEVGESNEKYRVVATDAVSGCTAISNTIPISISIPEATIGASGNTALCPGQSVTLVANFGSSYLWNNGATSQEITVSSAGSYSVSVTNSQGCSKTSPVTSVTTNPEPTATITPSGSTTFCAGGQVYLTASYAQSYTYLWSNGSTAQSIPISTQGSYYVTVTDATTHCSKTSTAVNISVNSLPNIIVSGPTSACGSATLTASGGTSYLWSGPGISGSGNYKVVSSLGTNTYTVWGYDSNGCYTRVDRQVTIYSSPSISISGASSGCNYVSLTASGGTSYSWSGPGVSGSGTTKYAYSTGWYYATGYNSSGCSSTASKYVTVNPTPSVYIYQSAGNTCSSSTVSLTAYATSGSSYYWPPAPPYYSSSTYITVQAKAGQTRSVTVTKNGCSATAYYYVDYCSGGGGGGGGSGGGGGGQMPRIAASDDVTSDELLVVLDDVTIYPNPVNRELEVTLQAPASERILVHLTSQLGVVSRASNFEVGQQFMSIDVSDLTEGVYFLQLGSGADAKREKVMVLHK